MSDHTVMGALVAARDYFRQRENDSQTYGFFPGGDPREFTPDAEVCTPEELAAWKDACAAWERGERPEHEAHHHTTQVDGDRVVMTSHPGAFGMGVYSFRDPDAEDVLEQVEAAIASLSNSTGEGA